MKKKIISLFTGTLLAIVIVSCGEEIDCDGFDLNSEIMDWYFVLDVVPEVSYIDSNGTEYAFNQTVFWKTEAETVKCGGCIKCECEPPMLATTYYNTDLGLTFSSSITNTYGPRLTLSHDSAHYDLNIDMTDNYVYSFDTTYIVTPVDTFTIFNSTLMNVFEINVLSDNFKFWMKKDVGMVAFERNNSLYKLN